MLVSSACGLKLASPFHLFYKHFVNIFVSLGWTDKSDEETPRFPVKQHMTSLELHAASVSL